MTSSPTISSTTRPHHHRVAFITGSSSGIGLAIARKFASQGAAIALHGREAPSAVESLVSDIQQEFGVSVRYFCADFQDAATFTPLIAHIQDTLGSIDILVNNAGIQHVAPMLEFPVSQWNAMLAINLSAAFHTMRLCAPGMLANNWGRIINIASVSGLVGVAGKSAYVTAKHGLIGLTKSVALEFATTAVTCNAICPGWVLTPLVQQQIDALAQREGLNNVAATHKLLGAKQPSQAFVTVEHVASLAAYLASEDAAQVRGAHWNIDGGFVAA